MKSISVDGGALAYAENGSGNAVVLIHGFLLDHSTWDSVTPRLASRARVLRPDLRGLGRSSVTPGPYLIELLAADIAALLDAKDIATATLVGHSLGGGVAMQFSYQFPEMTERLVLMSSGGLGRELHAILRMAALPGAEVVLPWLCSSRLRGLVEGSAKLLGRAGVRAGTDVREVWRGVGTLFDADTRRAFLQTMRTVVDVGGQR
ncbi:MAG: alpha/beta fold hydrolase, partial [Vulcanimicrobiaceae bacterium]